MGPQEVLGRLRKELHGVPQPPVPGWDGFPSPGLESALPPLNSSPTSDRNEDPVIPVGSGRGPEHFTFWLRH